jgi:hypothetical protein
VEEGALADLLLVDGGTVGEYQVDRRSGKKSRGKIYKHLLK